MLLNPLTGALTCTLQNSNMYMALELAGKSIFFFLPPAHLRASQKWLKLCRLWRKKTNQLDRAHKTFFKQRHTTILNVYIGKEVPVTAQIEDPLNLCLIAINKNLLQKKNRSKKYLVVWCLVHDLWKYCSKEFPSNRYIYVILLVHIVQEGKKKKGHHPIILLPHIYAL